MQEHEKIELRSEEVQEILGTPPSWLVRWGTAVIFGTFAALLAVAYFLRYPDLIDAEITLTSSVPPIDVIARSEGHLERFLVKDFEKTERGKVLALLQSTARWEDVQILDSLVAKLSMFDRAGAGQFSLPKRLELGELQASYSTMVQLFEDFSFSTGEKSQFDFSRIDQLRRQQGSIRQAIESDDAQKRKSEQKLGLAKAYFDNQQKLYIEKVISLRELEEARGKVIEAEREVEAFSSGKIGRDLEIGNLDKEIASIGAGSKEEAVTKFVALSESVSKIAAELEAWKQKYLLRAPISGQVSLNSEFFSANQFVKAGESVMSIVPEGAAAITGRANLPLLGSGKVEIGQAVKIRLANFPYEEYGLLEGRVSSKGSVPKNNALPILVELENGLTTTYGKKLVFEQNMQGAAEIITRDRRFIERIFDSILSAIKN